MTIEIIHTDDESIVKKTTLTDVLSVETMTKYEEGEYYLRLFCNFGKKGKEETVCAGFEVDDNENEVYEHGPGVGNDLYFNSYTPIKINVLP